jgi:hypothetical protein
MSDGSLLVTDNYEHCVWKVSTEGSPEKFVSGEPLDRPVGLCISGDDFLIADPHIRTIFTLRTNGELSVFMASPAR